MVYLKEHRIPHPGGLKWENFEVKLKDKVKATLADLDPKKQNAALNSAREIADGKKEKVHTLDILNDYIHNDKSLPAPSELITAWDRLHPYFDAMCSNMTEE